MTKNKIVTAEQLAQAQDTTALISNEMHDDRDLVNQLLGQIQMADAFSRFSQTVCASKLAFIRDNKLYRQLKGKKTADGLRLNGTWDEFCVLLGMTRGKADEDIANLREFGEQALESMSRMGIGYRELRQFRKLPEDEKQALIEVAKEGDKEGFAEVAETIIAKHTKEKEALKKQLEDTKLDLEASRTTASKKESALTKAENELEKLKVRIQKMTPVELGEQLRAEATQAINKVELAIRGDFYGALKALFEHQNETGVNHSSLMTGFLTLIRRAVNEVAIELEIEDSFDDNPIPDFLREDAEITLEEATRKAYEEAGVPYEE